MNILFSATRQWNPGDEIILRGVINLMQSLGLKFNPILWNRHPSIRPGNCGLDNSFDTQRHNICAIDYVVFAGSPQWSGSRVRPLLQNIGQSEGRCSFVGIGTPSGGIYVDKLTRNVLNRNTDLVICRDALAYDAIKTRCPNLAVYNLPCPSIFHSARSTVKNRLDTIGCIYQSNRTKWHSVSALTKQRMRALFGLLAEQFEITIICHYIDDVDEASKIYPPDRVRYSYDAADYDSFYNEVDFVVGARVHGCLGAMGSGTPAMLVATEDDERRRATGDNIPLLLKGDLASPELILEQIKSCDIAELSREIAVWRDDVRAGYAQLFIPVIDRLVSAGPRNRSFKEDRGNIFRFHDFVNMIHTAPFSVVDRLRRWFGG